MAEKETKLDLDFSGLSEKRESVPGESKVTKQDLPPPLDEPFGIIIALDAEPISEIKDGKETKTRRYVFKDLADLTGDEFIEWAKRVFPFDRSKVSAQDFATRIAKKVAFDRIIRFHQLGFLQQKKESKSYLH